MLTKNEITTLSLSPTKKDFVQIWNELLEVAGKLSERWDPTSTNESDPGIVILKALTGIADKLNYNIDKNTLEAFMPTAAQEDSMRKLCDMLGYNVKYYRSAETTVTVKYYNNDPSEEEEKAIGGGLWIPKFTVITNSDQDVSYFTTNPTDYYISSTTPSVKLPCMEGQIVMCESTSDNNVITVSQISENNRFYLPEAQVAENGIFVYNVFSAGDTLQDGTPWDRVDNLNIQARGSRVFKFGYDSYESRPYIEFPGDYSELINDGLFIYYARTSGANGNVSPRTLTQLEIPSTWEGVSAESFSVENTFAATTGANIETIQQAYNNFKKTIGTFETLVTCRDYMNKIYTMTNDETGKPLVSNVLVTDIRNDLNRAVTICSCDDAGIFYKDTPLTTSTAVTKTIKTSTGAFVTGELTIEEPAIDHFDLVIYPFKSYTQIKGNVKDIQEVYDSAFRYDSKSFTNVKNAIDTANVKTIAHNIIGPREHDIVNINNYFRLNAIIGTNVKITVEEGALLIETIKIALANAFSMRELDFSEEIPFESIVEVIEKADPRIKVVSLNEPALYTTFSVFEGDDFFGNPIIKEYAVASDWLTADEATATGRFEYVDEDNNPIHTFDTVEAKKIYNKLAIRNVLAGRVPLFKYNNTFKASFYEGAYRTPKVVAVEDLPAAMRENSNFRASKDRPNVIYTDNNKVYSGKYAEVPANEKPTQLEEPTATKTSTTYKDSDGIEYTGEYDAETETVSYSKIEYIEEAVPEKYANNLITNNSSAAGNLTDFNITELTTSCEIYTDQNTQDAHISNVTLSDGEFVKFRAPNFITTKTYPAYVNYHLRLNQKTVEPSRAAQASKLFDLLNGFGTPADALWSKVFDTRTTALNSPKLAAKKQKFTLTQEITYTEVDGIIIKNPSVSGSGETPEAILAKSGCVLLCNKGVPIIEGTTALSADYFKVSFETDYYFITNKDVFASIKSFADDQLNKIPIEDMPKEDWTISYTFEYIPFESGTLSLWEDFVKELFNPAHDGGTVLWRSYGDTYKIGKCVLETGAKLLPFTSEYFGSLDAQGNLNSRLEGIYIASDLGADEKANFINNDEEYMLRAGEYLCTEYTPSSTTEDGASQQQESVKEIFGEGTIIKPSGFENGLIDSTVYKNTHSAVKSITFDIPNGTDLALFSFGANEQVAIREKSQVTLTSDLFTNSSTINIYKNFNDCEPLEGIAQYKDGKRINSSYTLKDGEYIFYTDKNKTELAYFTTGTEVTLLGAVRLPKFDIIDLAVIFDSGLQDIPWYQISLNGDNGINFQEYQYVTVGPNDTIEDLTLLGETRKVGDDEVHRIDSEWQYCEHIAYRVAGSDTVTTLPTINLAESSEKGCGWEASSVLELNVSPSTVQTLRTTEQVKTNIALQKVNKATGELLSPIILEAEDAEHPLSFKANLTCQSSTGKAKIAELYTNADNLKSFEFKVFSEEAPAILKTLPNTLIPYTGVAADETIKASTVNTFTLAERGELWSQVSFTALTPVSTSLVAYDRALKLPISTLPNTYGIFSIYVDYSYAAKEAGAEAWIELLPGSNINNVTLFNADNTVVNNKLILRPGLNCVRVNTTCDLHIKADSNADGILYFDELRLINTERIESIGEDGSKTYQTTQGLNLEQLGYLDTSDESSFSVFDMKVRKKLKNDFTSEALNQLDSLAKTKAEEFTIGYKELLDSKAKVQELIKFIDNAEAEISALSALASTTAGANKIEALFNSYKDVCTDLEQEIALKEALANNKNIDDIEQHLATMLNDMAALETDQQVLLDELGILREKAIAASEGFYSLLKEDILDDFKASASTLTDKTLKEALKIVSLGKINAQYSEQLSLIEKGISDIADSEISAKITTAVEKLNAKKHSIILGQVQSLISASKAELDAAIDATTNAYEVITEGTGADATYRVNYNEVKTKLDALRVVVTELDLSAIVAKIEFTAEERLYNNLAKLVDDLKTLLATEDTALLKAIDSLTTKVQAKITANNFAPDTTIANAVTALKSSLYDDRNSRITNVLADINESISASDSTYSKIIDDLNTVQDARITELAEQLETITRSRNTLAATVTSFGTGSDFNVTTDYILLPFGEESVLYVWPAHMRQTLIAGVDALYSDIRTIIKLLPDSVNVENTITENFKVGGKDRKLLTKAADIKAFKKLLKRAEIFASESAQNEKRNTLITTLSSLPISPELTTAINAITNDAGADRLGRNAVICDMLNQIKTPADVVEKQEVMAKLIEELDAEILLDTKLVELSAKLLCPSILLYEEKSNSFYNRLNEFVENKKAELLAVTSDYSVVFTSIISSLDAQQTVTAIFELLCEVAIEEFTEELATLKTVLNTLNATPAASYTLLLTKDYINKFISLLSLIDSQDQIAKVKGLKLFDILTKNDLTVAWYAGVDAQSNPIWLDSSGVAFTNTSGTKWQTAAGKLVDIDAKRNNAGVWVNATGAAIEIKTDTTWLATDPTKSVAISALSDELNTLLNNLLRNVGELGQTLVPEAFKDAWSTLRLEEQLLDEIKAIDVNREFYYNVPVEANVAIDFNESDAKLNTLMNPALNYDINNVNNNFVISKLDINYLTKGLQIARSSRIS